MFVPSSQKHNEYITFLSLSLPLMHNKYAKESDFVRVFRLIKCPLIFWKKPWVLTNIYFLNIHKHF